MQTRLSARASNFISEVIHTSKLPSAFDNVPRTLLSSINPLALSDTSYLEYLLSFQSREEQQLNDIIEEVQHQCDSVNENITSFEQETIRWKRQRSNMSWIRCAAELRQAAKEAQWEIEQQKAAHDLFEELEESDRYQERDQQCAQVVEELATAATRLGEAAIAADLPPPPSLLVLATAELVGETLTNAQRLSGYRHAAGPSLLDVEGIGEMVKVLRSSSFPPEQAAPDPTPRVLVIGGAGTGRSSVAMTLADRLNARLIRFDAILGSLGVLADAGLDHIEEVSAQAGCPLPALQADESLAVQEGLSRMQRGLGMPDAALVSLVAAAVRAGGSGKADSVGCVVDGFPLTAAQGTLLETALGGSLDTAPPSSISQPDTHPRSWFSHLVHVCSDCSAQRCVGRLWKDHSDGTRTEYNVTYAPPPVSPELVQALEYDQTSPGTIRRQEVSATRAADVIRIYDGVEVSILTAFVGIDADSSASIAHEIATEINDYCEELSALVLEEPHSSSPSIQLDAENPSEPEEPETSEDAPKPGSKSGSKSGPSRSKSRKGKDKREKVVAEPAAEDLFSVFPQLPPDTTRQLLQTLAEQQAAEQRDSLAALSRIDAAVAQHYTWLGSVRSKVARSIELPFSAWDEALPAHYRAWDAVPRRLLGQPEVVSELLLRADELRDSVLKAADTRRREEEAIITEVAESLAAVRYPTDPIPSDVSGSIETDADAPGSLLPPLEFVQRVRSQHCAVAVAALQQHYGFARLLLHQSASAAGLLSPFDPVGDTKDKEHAKHVDHVHKIEEILESVETLSSPIQVVEGPVAEITQLLAKLEPPCRLHEHTLSLLQASTTLLERKTLWAVKSVDFCLESALSACSTRLHSLATKAAQQHRHRLSQTLTVHRALVSLHRGLQSPHRVLVKPNGIELVSPPPIPERAQLIAHHLTGAPTGQLTPAQCSSVLDLFVGSPMWLSVSPWARTMQTAGVMGLLPPQLAGYSQDSWARTAQLLRCILRHSSHIHPNEASPPLVNWPRVLVALVLPRALSIGEFQEVLSCLHRMEASGASLSEQCAALPQVLPTTSPAIAVSWQLLPLILEKLALAGSTDSLLDLLSYDSDSASEDEKMNMTARRSGEIVQ